MSTDRGWRMPAEWEPHTRTWMAWPSDAEMIAAVGSAAEAEAAWTALASALAAFEPVTMLVPPARAAAARAMLGEGVTLLEVPLGDGWLRDSGPSFVLDRDGRLGAVDWTFNGWGGRTFPRGAADALVARRVAEAAGAERIVSTLVNEGGGVHVDGAGVVLLTETVQLSPTRNPNRSKAEVEAEILARVGATKAIWVPRGLVADMGALGTDGHIDTLACFVKPGVVVVHGQPDPAHPDYETARELHAIFSAETDARGRKLEVVTLDPPAEVYEDGEPLSCSYVNFCFANGGLVLCAFDDPKDHETVEIFRRLLPDRKAVLVDALPIFRGGGGLHCITQHEPASRAGA